MKAIIEIPDDKNVYIFSERTVIYKKEPNGPLMKKTVFCNFCGECCRGGNWPYNDENGQCQHLVFERVHHEDGTVDEGWFCKMQGDLVPFTCCKGRGKPANCVIRFEEVAAWEDPTTPKPTAE